MLTTRVCENEDDGFVPSLQRRGRNYDGTSALNLFAASNFLAASEWSLFGGLLLHPAALIELDGGRPAEPRAEWRDLRARLIFTNRAIE